MRPSDNCFDASAATSASSIWAMKAWHGLALVALMIFWAFCNPFFATDRGSLIYSARALADLDPSGVGRDIMFRYDGQSAFTIFTGLFRGLTAALGPSLSALLLTIASIAIGFLGAAIFATTLLKGPARYLAIAFAAALPTYYGGYRLFSYAEAAATPRPFAEALVICGFAALLTRRHLLAAALMAGATLLHPIMALAGVAVLLIWMALEDRRWMVVILVLTALLAGAALAGVPPFDRIAIVIDPEWQRILIERNPHLFPTLWPSGWIGRMVTRIATLLIAASLVQGNARRLFLLVPLVGFLGFAVGYVINEWFGLLLVVQAQTWRTMWIVFFMATTAAAICIVQLWPRGGSARIALALLALAWIYADNDLFAVALSLIAIGLHYGLEPKAYTISPALLRCTLAILAALALVGLAHTQIAFHSVFADAPASLKDDARRTIALSYDYMPFAVGAALVALLGRPRASLPAIGVMAAIGALVLTLSWDQRSAADVFMDAGHGVPDLENIVDSRPGEIYWIDGGRETWWWLHRPQWLTVIQGAGIVFSRDLAVLYSRRAHRAIDLGLADDDILTPLLEPHETSVPFLTRDNVHAFCALPEAPSWIIAPLVGGSHLPVAIAGTEWAAPVEKLEPIEQGKKTVWKHFYRYAVVPCAPLGGKSNG